MKYKPPSFLIAETRPELEEQHNAFLKKLENEESFDLKKSLHYQSDIIDKMSLKQKNDLAHLLSKNMDEIREMSSEDMLNAIEKKLKKPEGVRGVILESRYAMLRASLFGVVVAGYFMNPELVNYLQVLGWTAIAVGGLTLEYIESDIVLALAATELSFIALVKDASLIEIITLDILAFLALLSFVESPSITITKKKYRLLAASVVMYTSLPVASSLISDVSLMDTANLTLLGGAIGASIGFIVDRVKKKVRSIQGNKVKEMVDTVQKS